MIRTLLSICVALFSIAVTSWSQQVEANYTSLLTDRTTERVQATGEAGLTAVINQTSPVIGCGVPVTLTASITGANGISWKRNGEFITGATTETFIANQSGTYAVVVVSNLCQYESAPVEVILQSPLNAIVEAPSGLEACVGDSVQLHAGGGTAAWQWLHDGVAIEGATAPEFSASEPGSYSVIGDEGSVCASTSAEVSVIVHQLPNVSIAWVGTPAICFGDSLELAATLQSNQLLLWYWDENLITGANSSAHWADATGQYHALVTDTTTGCSSYTNSVSLEVFTPQTVVVDVNGPASFCQGQQVVLSLAQGEGLAQWYRNGAAVESATGVVLTVDSEGSYEVRLTDVNGCASPSQAVEVIVYALPDALINFAGASSFLCGLDTVLLEIETGNTYAWFSNDSLIAGANSNQLMVTSAGIYTAQVANANGCVTFSQAVDITAFAAPQVILEPSGEINVCAGQSLVFDAQATAAIQYTWYLNGEIYSSDFVSVLEAIEPGAWTVAVTDENGCVAMSEPALLNVLNVALPVITLGELTAEGQWLLSDDASGHQWYWNGEMITGATDSSYFASQEGYYSVISIEDVCESALSDSVLFLFGSVGEQMPLLGLYPNPCTDFITLAPSQWLGMKCAIYDLSGRQVWEGLLNNSRVEIDVRSWSVGMYSLVTERGDCAVFSVVR